MTGWLANDGSHVYIGTDQAAVLEASGAAQAAPISDLSMSQLNELIPLLSSSTVTVLDGGEDVQD